MDKKRDSFIFYRSFHEAITNLPDQDRLIIYEAIAEFSLNFKEPNLDGISKAIWCLIRPNLEANNKRFENGSKKKRSKTEAKPKQNESNIEANKDKDKDVDKDNREKTPHDVWNSEGIRNPKDALTCQGYFQGLKDKHKYQWQTEDVATRFFEHYAAKGWMVNGAKITNWTYKANEWARSEKDRNGVKTKEQPASWGRL